MITDIEEIKRRMQAGEELRNRGTGWWIEAPRKPYSACNAQLVNPDLVALLEAQGHVKTELLTVSIVGRWVEPAASVGVAL